jgi:hypothetical protein
LDTLKLVGKKFGYLTVVKFDHEAVIQINKRKKHESFWLCQCDCGRQKIVKGHNLEQGRTRSCGHLISENSKLTQKNNPQIVENLKALRPDGHMRADIEPAYHPTHKSKIAKNNKSGITGVTFCLVNNKPRWVAKLYYQGRYVLNRRFEDKEDAIKARLAAEKKYLKKSFEYQERKSIK